MAFSAHKDPEDVKERFDPPETVRQMASKLAKWIRLSRHFIAFTGAGISTSAGIPDFRGPNGVWTLRAQGRTVPADRVTPTSKAVPTPAHMSLVALQDAGMLKYLVSQNTDGLHRKSGILPDRISELHGNTNREICSRCGKEYVRDFRTRTAADVHDHRTGRHCTLCGGELLDSIINFGESLPRKPLQRAFEHASLADLCLVLGSSCAVSPANEIPRIVGMNPRAQLVIVNLQRTPLDSLADMKISARCDDIMQQVMQELGIETPPFILRRRVIVSKSSDNNYVIAGVDVDDEVPASFINKVQVFSGPPSEAGARPQVILKSEPFVIPSSASGGGSDGREMWLRLHFMGHYNEPVVDLPFHRGRVGALYNMFYNPRTGEWRVEEEGNAPHPAAQPTLPEGTPATEEQHAPKTPRGTGEDEEEEETEH